MYDDLLDSYDDDAIVLDRDYPQPRDVRELGYSAPAPAEERPADPGWVYDRTWTPRRILFTALVLFALLALIVYSLYGLFAPTPAAPVSTPAPLPLV